MKRVTCPVEGCEYSGPRQSVVGHYSGKQDNDHSGGYFHAQELVDGDPPDDFDGNQGTVQDDTMTDDSTDDGQDSSDNPAFDGPDADPPEGHTCTECGNQLLEPGDEFDHNGRRMQVDDGEYVCDHCALVYDEEEL